jgi:predicted nuclease with RNAse H fold
MAVGVGVDVSVRRGLDLVVLDGRRRLVGPPLARQTPDDLEALLRRLQPDAVAIDSPPAWGVRGTSRRAERELIALGLPCFRTPSDPGLRAHPFYGWMFAGHAAFAVAARAGYPCFTGGPEGRGRALEVFPHGAAVALAGHRPPAGTARRPAAKRRWRTAVLAAAGVDVTPLRTLDAIDAALAALVALIVAEDGPWFSLGEADEGCVVLPGRRPAGPYPRSAEDRSEPEGGAGAAVVAGPLQTPQDGRDHPGGDQLEEDGADVATRPVLPGRIEPE